MKRDIVKTGVVVMILGVALFAHSQDAFAGKGSKRQYRNHPYDGMKVKLSSRPKAVVVNRHNFYYSGGFFFELFGGDYVISSAPVGAVVISLPRNHKRVIFNGVDYYYYNDVYYVRQPRGYVVVEDPIYYIPQMPSNVKVVSEPEYAEGAQDSFTVYVPNNSGGYSPVVIKRSGEGFVGPQGEYYPKFPKVDQLKTMYCG